jgi:hypothetical protein
MSRRGGTNSSFDDLFKCSPQGAEGKRVLQKLKDYSVMQNFEHLIERGADREELLFILTELNDYDPTKNEPHKVPSKEARAWAKRITETAHLIEQITKRASYARLDSMFSTTLPLPKSFLRFAPNEGVAHFDGNHLRTLPQLLREYARRVESLPHSFEEKWKPFRTALLSQLVSYVKRRTGKCYDKDVAALAAVLLSESRLSAWTIKEFRKRNAASIRMLGPLQVIPILPSRPR